MVRRMPNTEPGIPQPSDRILKQGSHVAICVKVNMNRSLGFEILHRILTRSPILGPSSIMLKVWRHLSLFVLSHQIAERARREYIVLRARQIRDDPYHHATLPELLIPIRQMT